MHCTLGIRHLPQYLHGNKKSAVHLDFETFGLPWFWKLDFHKNPSASNPWSRRRTQSPEGSKMWNLEIQEEITWKRTAQWISEDRASDKMKIVASHEGQKHTWKKNKKNATNSCEPQRHAYCCKEGNEDILKSATGDTGDTGNTGLEKLTLDLTACRPKAENASSTP